MKKTYLDKANKTQPVVFLDAKDRSKTLEIMREGKIAYSVEIQGGFEIYVPDQDPNKQGILSRIINGVQNFANEQGVFQ